MDVSSQGGGSRASSLEGLLQQAWLQSQSRPKMARRRVSEPLTCATLEGRTSSQSFAKLILGADSGGAREGSASEETHFHKTRSEGVPEFFKRRATPRLESYSKKTQLPRARSASAAVERRVSRVSDRDGGSSQDSPGSLLSHSASDLSNAISGGASSETHTSMDELFDVVDSEGGLADLACETEVLDHYFDVILNNDNLDLEKCLMQMTTASHAAKKVPGYPEAGDGERGDSAEFLTIDEISRSMEETSTYQAMAKDVASLLSTEAEEVDGAECAVEGFAPSEELTALTIMEGFTCMMSKHIQDVSVCGSDAVDYRMWIKESDSFDVYFDDAWRSYFEEWQQSFRIASSLDSSAGAVTLPFCSDMTELLYRCALAVSRGDSHSATECLEELRKRSSPYGNSVERLAHYAREALVARMSGTGEQLYTVITNNHPSAETMMNAYRALVDSCPYVKLKHFLSTKAILDACEGASRVHVIHYGALLGTEWPSLLLHLSMRPGGPPHFRLTGVDIPYPGDEPLKKLQAMGRRLEQFAKKYGVPFEFQAFAGNWESFTARDINIRKDEVLAVSSHRAHLIHDEGVLSASPRELLLRRMRSLNPKVVVLFVESAACNAPFFMTRFRESVKHYAALYDGLEIALAPDSRERAILEKEVFGRELLNIIACEGQARIERAEPYRQWQNRMDRAGFILRPLNPVVFSKVKAMMASFHQDFGVGEDDGWLLMGVRDRITCASGVYEPKATMSFINT